MNIAQWAKSIYWVGKNRLTVRQVEPIWTRTKRNDAGERKHVISASCLLLTLLLGRSHLKADTLYRVTDLGTHLEKPTRPAPVMVSTT